MGKSRTEDVDERTGLRRYRRESAAIGRGRGKSTTIDYVRLVDERASGINERLVGGSGRTAADGGSVGVKRRGRSSLERDRVCELSSGANPSLSLSLFYPAFSPSPPSLFFRFASPFRASTAGRHRRGGRRRVPLDGEENLRPTAASRYLSLPSRDGEKRRLTRNFSSFTRLLAYSRHTSSRGRGRAGTNRRTGTKGK